MAVAPALIALALVVRFRGVLLGRVFWFEDIQAYFVPLYSAAARSMRAGELPLFAPEAWAGQPLLGDPQIGIFYPPNWLWLVISPVRMYAVSAVLHAAVAASGAYALGRARGRSTQASATSAMALVLSAFMVLELRHAMFCATTAWLFWVMYGLTRFAERRRPSALALTSAATGMALLAGGWSMLPFAAPVIIVYASFRLFEWPARMRLKGLIVLVGAGVLGLALAAPQLLPAIAHGKESPRALSLTYEAAASYSWPSWRYVLTLVLPTYFGDDARGTYVGASDQWELCGYGAGLFATLFALTAVALRRGRTERLLLFALCLLAMEFALGPNGRIHRFLFEHVRLFSQIRCPARALYIIVLVVPLLAADGVDAAFGRWPHLREIAPLLVAIELLVVFRAENPTVSYAETTRRPAAVGRLLMEHGRAMTDVHLGQRFHNAGLEWGFECAGGYSSLPLWRYLHLLWIANHGRVYPSAKLNHDLTAQGLWSLSSPIIDLLGVKWVLAPHDRPPNGSGFTPLFSGDDGVDLWRNDEALPRAFVVYSARVAVNDEEAAEKVAAADFRPDRDAIVSAEFAAHVPLALGHSFGRPFDAARDWSRAGSRVQAFIEVAAPGLLVFSEPFSRGWSAMVDGRRAEVFPVDYALVGVAVGPGTHQVVLNHSVQGLRLGLLLCAVALACILVLTLWPPNLEFKKIRQRQF